MEPTSFPETSTKTTNVRCIRTQKRGDRLHRGRSLKSHTEQINFETAKEERDKSRYKKMIRHSHVWKRALVFLCVFILVLIQMIFI
jgi:hypothetical protein